MKIQPGLGYTFDSSSQGFTLDTSGLDGQFPDNPGVGPYHPFQVTNLGLKTGTTDYYFKVQPGLVNNLDPMIEGTSWFMTHIPVSDWLMVYYKWSFNVTTGFSWIVLKLGYDAATDTFPDSDITHVSASPSYPVVASLSYEPTTNNTDAYLTIAKAYQNPTTKEITISQYVTGSLWSLRVQFGTTNAYYYYNRI